ncbi:acyltransferase family protein [Pseudodesulfovibrio portus]|uniref:acyltransferase family protein n=1 Tax=Pseudodesulfovibrio portus TaxID=231439 RepID=UPI0022308255|nr:acyltransferase [Pseudodesulfovibrio portus]
MEKVIATLREPSSTSTKGTHVNSSRELTSYLKGFAILTVVGSHFSNRFMPFKLPLFGNHFITFFFILSGFGLYYSLSRTHDEKTKLISFYLKRFIRIYPLYWANFFIDLIFDRGQSLSSDLFFDFFLIHFTDPPRAWFLHALIPCYVLAPALYALIRKYRLKMIPALCVLFGVANLVLHYFSAPEVRCWMYRNIYLSEYFLFCIGMLFPIIHENYGASGKNRWVLLTSLVMLGSFIFTNGYTYIPPIPGNNTTFVSCLFIVSTLVFSYLFINAYTIYLPFKRILCLVGSYTYGIYLFEGMYGTALEKIGVIAGKNYVNGLFFILIFPAFFICCMLAEELFDNRFNVKLSVANVKGKISSTFARA